LGTIESFGRNSILEATFDNALQEVEYLRQKLMTWIYENVNNLEKIAALQAQNSELPKLQHQLRELTNSLSEMKDDQDSTLKLITELERDSKKCASLNVLIVELCEKLESVMKTQSNSLEEITLLKKANTTISDLKEEKNVLTERINTDKWKQTDLLEKIKFLEQKIKELPIIEEMSEVNARLTQSRRKSQFSLNWRV